MRQRVKAALSPGLLIPWPWRRRGFRERTGVSEELFPLPGPLR